MKAEKPGNAKSENKRRCRAWGLFGVAYFMAIQDLATCCLYSKKRGFGVRGFRVSDFGFRIYGLGPFWTSSRRSFSGVVGSQTLNPNPTGSPKP